MSQRKSSVTREALLQAACRIVLTNGVANMTLEAVAREAGVSKGGLLYHFPTKEALITDMIAQLIANFTAALDRESDRDIDEDKAGKWLRAYVRASFNPDQEELNISASLLAAVATNPELLTPLRTSYIDWQQRTEQDGLNPAIATLIRLAADGLWFNELLGFAPLSEPLRTQVLTKLLELSNNAAPRH